MDLIRQQQQNCLQYKKMYTKYIIVVNGTILTYVHVTATDSVQRYRLYYTVLNVYVHVSMYQTLFFVREKSFELSQDVVSALCFLEEFTHYSYLPRKAVERHIPSYIFDEFRHHLQ